ncbi:MAG: NAD-dependent epimerase/dehydratase family protein [Kiritimatiellae bacterium]|nr:NAD-dependent epimerase/dehydratase family protein [Bacteroidales bacterium]MBR3222439.1 NAD-dependent epimerase/dehydratase family protein [Kiritimatiellia bacterium]
MKRLLEISEYVEDVKRVASFDLPWEKLRDKTILITGGTGLIGSFLVDVLNAARLDCKVLLFGRSEERAKTRFAEYWDKGWIHFVKWDSSEGFERFDEFEEFEKFDYMLHLASNTHPVAYATDPIGTITTNVIALNNLLALAAEKCATRFLFASSNEIYGENRGDVELFDEKYCGYIDCNTLRAGYPESKRCGEALCQAYIRQKNLDCVIARLTRTYGPTILSTDTKAISQFFNNALKDEDIVLKSEGKQYYSYQYVVDSVSGLMTVLLKGDCGAAYNIADESSDITLRDLAALIAKQAGRKVVFDLPDAVEAAGFSKATKARLDGARLRALGWLPSYDIKSGVMRNYCVLKKSRA